MIAKAASVALVGMEGHPIDVEVSLAQGLPAFNIVGLPDASIQEARERVRSAIQASEEEWPLKRVTVNLSPAHLRKAGSSFDLAMALGVVAAGGRIDEERLRRVFVLGELSLDGTVRRVRGILPSTIAAAQGGARAVLVPSANAREAALVPGMAVFPVDHLGRAIRFLRGECSIDPCVDPARADASEDSDVDLSDVRGNAETKRALEVAAAGGHNVLMIGSPGGGKTMLARRLSTILPAMTDAESFEVTRIYSVAGLLPEDRPLITRRPFRAPHHTGSTTALVGGGSGMPHPGEVTLAHRGVLFLDEFGEFRREVMQALRQPMEDGTVTIVRSKWAVTYPSRFQLIAASNPCPCGFVGDQLRACICGENVRARYNERLSGPIIDRIDIQVRVARIKKHELFDAPEGEASSVIAARVGAARARQLERLRGFGLTCNAEIAARDLNDICAMRIDAQRQIEGAVERGTLSARGAHRTMRVARTIADLREHDTVTLDDVMDALNLRRGS